MTTYREVTKLSLLSGAEEAMIGWSWDTAANAATVKSAIDARIDALWTAWKDEFHSSVSLVERNLLAYDTATGALLSTTPLALPAGTAGTLAGNPLPPQLAMVMSIRTATPGPRGRGRFYLPAGSTSILAADGLLPLVTRQDLVDGFGVYVNGLQGDILDMHLSVWSRTHGTADDATKIQMGSVWDTQRRRRSGLVESRYTVTV